jgi:hypothetical protein
MQSLFNDFGVSLKLLQSANKGSVPKPPTAGRHHYRTYAFMNHDPAAVKKLDAFLAKAESIYYKILVFRFSPTKQPDLGENGGVGALEPQEILVFGKMK